MDAARSIIERVAFALLRFAATCMTFAGVALVAPVLALAAFDAAATETVAGGALRLAATFTAAGLFCLLVARRRTAWLPDGPNAGASIGSGFDGWLVLLPLTLVATPVLLMIMLSPLATFWRDVLTLADELGFWQEMQRGGAGAGFVLMPVIAALAVPGLEAIAAVTAVLVCVLLFTLLMIRSSRVPRALLLCVSLQGALVLACTLGTGTVERLVPAIEQLIRDTPDPGGIEQARASRELERYQAVARSASRTLLVAWVATAIWLPLLFLTPARERFSAGAIRRDDGVVDSEGRIDPGKVAAMDEATRASAYVKAARELERPARSSRWF